MRVLLKEGAAEATATTILVFLRPGGAILETLGGEPVTRGVIAEADPSTVGKAARDGIEMREDPDVRVKALLEELNWLDGFLASHRLGATIDLEIADVPVFKPHTEPTGDRRLICVATVDPAPASSPNGLAVRAAYTHDQMDVALMHMVERSEVSTTHQRQAERQAAIKHGNGFAGFEHANGCRSILADPVRCHTRQAAAYLYDTPVATVQQHEALLEVMFAEGSPNRDHFDIHTEKLPEWIGPAIYTDDAIYVPVAFADGQMGYAVNSPTGGRQEFIYLNPSGETDDGKPNVFLYHGPVGDPVDDTPQHHYLVLVDEDQEGAREAPGFSLSIELGDGEMQTGEHVASVLQTLADHLRES
ncbi:MAG TPA: hypothetical protein VJQ84_09180, partial [Solirubrobacterales bacterium]|nr:hypothetical protein [Solirubrobacterales bacterium]